MRMFPDLIADLIIYYKWRNRINSVNGQYKGIIRLREFGNLSLYIYFHNPSFKRHITVPVYNYRRREMNLFWIANHKIFVDGTAQSSNSNHKLPKNYWYSGITVEEKNNDSLLYHFPKLVADKVNLYVWMYKMRNLNAQYKDIYRLYIVENHREMFGYCILMNTHIQRDPSPPGTRFNYRRPDNYLIYPQCYILTIFKPYYGKNHEDTDILVARNTGVRLPTNY